ncbi:MAG: L-threonylcarbamoyladenylate synthase [Candidatus Omnitrophica bacterium]|nr:L-threonylcarbamoyladenylate synthase [Candidatus Omnitrophota bacterium]MCM8791205.1 L-threonylcarbamoyladenylate synthase [Candidatus Omnitrophota bacterium]
MKTIVFKVNPRRPDPALIACAARTVREGGLVAFPTETVYGLAANLLDAAAIERIYRVKKRSRDKPLTVHISDLAMIRKMGCRINRNAKKLIDAFWPGPLTIVLKSSKGKKIGFRMPANKIALWLIAASKVPVVAPSANLSGHKAPKSARAVLKELGGKIAMLLDGGKTAFGIESTVVDMTKEPPVILREGAINAKELFGELGRA